MRHVLAVAAMAASSPQEIEAGAAFFMEQGLLIRAADVLRVVSVHPDVPNPAAVLVRRAELLFQAHDSPKAVASLLAALDIVFDRNLTAAVAVVDRRFSDGAAPPSAAAATDVASSARTPIASAAAVERDMTAVLVTAPTVRPAPMRSQQLARLVAEVQLLRLDLAPTAAVLLAGTRLAPATRVVGHRAVVSGKGAPEGGSDSSDEDAMDDGGDGVGGDAGTAVSAVGEPVDDAAADRPMLAGPRYDLLGTALPAANMACELCLRLGAWEAIIIIAAEVHRFMHAAMVHEHANAAAPAAAGGPVPSPSLSAYPIHHVLPIDILVHYGLGGLRVMVGATNGAMVRHVSLALASQLACTAATSWRATPACSACGTCLTRATPHRTLICTPPSSATWCR